MTVLSFTFEKKSWCLTSWAVLLVELNTLWCSYWQIKMIYWCWRNKKRWPKVRKVVFANFVICPWSLNDINFEFFSLYYWNFPSFKIFLLLKERINHLEDKATLTCHFFGFLTFLYMKNESKIRHFPRKWTYFVKSPNSNHIVFRIILF